MKIIKGEIANALTSTADDHVVAVVGDIYDENKSQYLDEILSGLTQNIGDTIGGLNVSEVGGENKYISSISQNGGKIVAKAQQMPPKLNELDTSSDVSSLVGISPTGTPVTISTDDIIPMPSIYTLFDCIRELQGEIAKLRNSFIYGIESYQGKNTALSVESGGYEVDADEPLWATDENTLSLVYEMIFNNNGCELKPVGENSIVDTTVLDIATITGQASYTTNDSIYKITDPKLFLYLITSSRYVVIKFKEYDISTKNYIDSDKVINLDNILPDTSTSLYRLMICLGRNLDKHDTETSGYLDYAFIQITDQNGDDIVSGYFGEDFNAGLNASAVNIKSSLCYQSVIIGRENQRETCNVSRLNFYSKYQDLSNKVVESTNPSKQDYKYRTANISIRSISDSQTMMSIKDQIANNELIFVEDVGALFIKNNNIIQRIGGSVDNNNNNNNDTMNKQEFIEYLKDTGLIEVDTEGTGDNIKIISDFKLNSIGSVDFVNQDTGKKYNFTVNPYGELVSKEVDTTTLKSQITKYNGNFPTTLTNRGFNASLNTVLNGGVVNNTLFKSSVGLGVNADRIKIGAIYAPLQTDQEPVYGCSHAYIELENTSENDFYLDDCWLHYCVVNSNQTKIYHLALDGCIPAGGTYLIRGKQYANFNQSNTIIKVTTYDKEWYVGDKKELIDLSMPSDNGSICGFCLMYAGYINEKLDGVTSDNWDYKKYSTAFFDGSTDPVYMYSANSTGNEYYASSKTPYLYNPHFIDSFVYCYGMSMPQGTRITQINCYWAVTPALSVTNTNSILKNTFELDPAKQAFQALSTLDSSRLRWASLKADGSGDLQILNLDNDKISFPKSEETFDISKYTPKASFEHKNVSTDKTKMDMNKPNMLTSSFGINVYTTRCFNWVSSGLFKEYVWIAEESSDNWTKLASYETDVTPSSNTTGIYRKNFDENILNAVYKGVRNKFPGDGTYYTAHKVVANILDEAPSAPKTFKYVAGRSNTDGTPDIEHCSKEYTFTIYPSSYTPRLYHTTDQQGFHWVEYQVWAAAASSLNDAIVKDVSSNNVLPILINTGDMTQNGTRINEWLDYYNAGLPLFEHLEQMNVVGNNDLCGTDVTALGTGDDIGKSNSYFFHVFYCYEVDTTNTPIYNGKYIPSLYYFDTKDYRYLMVNSEITAVNCKSWFNALDAKGNVINIYTNWTIPNDTTPIPEYYPNIGTSIYTMLYKIIDGDKTKRIVVACHEMPFTVITNSELKQTSNIMAGYRSVSGGNLIGSHLNQITPSSTEACINWFSRLLEFKGVKLCIGGHKHTYSITYPVAENFKFTKNGQTYYSYSDYNNYSMEETLENDNCTWIEELNGATYNTTKLPLVLRSGLDTSAYPISQTISVGSSSVNIFLPTKQVTSLSRGVIYFMCQATGYKLTSNKELPSAKSTFSMLLPKTSIDSSGADKANTNQKYSMFGVFSCKTNVIDCDLYRFVNIQYGQKDTVGSTVFTQAYYSSDEIKYQSILRSDSDDYGIWQNSSDTLSQLDTDTHLISINY